MNIIFIFASIAAEKKEKMDRNNFIIFQPILKHKLQIVKKYENIFIFHSHFIIYPHQILKTNPWLLTM
jgi:hypothetical protein